MQYYSKSRKSPFVFRYFRGPFGIVDAYLTPLNGPPYGVSTGRCLFVIFPLRPRLASQREPRGESDPGKKGQTHAQRAPSPSRGQAHVRAARNHKSDTSILRRERIERIEREFKTIQGLIRRRRRRRLVSHRENLSRAPSTARYAYATRFPQLPLRTHSPFSLRFHQARQVRDRHYQCRRFSWCQKQED